MRVGIRVPQSAGMTPSLLREFAQTAESIGADSLWVVEHLLTPLRSGPERHVLPAAYASMLQPLETLSFLAGCTSTVRLGTSILVTALHRPLRLARELSTVDVLSNGRVICGLGLGYLPEEYEQMDTPWARRGARMAEFISALTACLGPDPVRFEGEFFRIPPCVSGPKPVQRDADGRPALPLVIAGGTSDAARRRIARHGDGWVPSVDVDSDPHAVVAVAEELRDAARHDGRSGTIETYLRGYVDLSWLGASASPIVPPALSWNGDPPELLARLRHAADAGIDNVILDLSQNVRDGEPFMPTPDTLTTLIPVFAGLGRSPRGGA